MIGNLTGLLTEEIFATTTGGGPAASSGGAGCGGVVVGGGGGGAQAQPRSQPIKLYFEHPLEVSACTEISHTPLKICNHFPSCVHEQADIAAFVSINMHTDRKASYDFVETAR